jgi:hypothetical protein
VLDILGGDGIEITLPKRQVINGIEHIGFSSAIVSNKAIDFGIKLELDIAEIFVIEQGNLLKKH